MLNFFNQFLTFQLDIYIVYLYVCEFVTVCMWKFFLKKDNLWEYSFPSAM